MQTRTITIVGLERVGLSIALALKAASHDFKLVGYDDDHQRAQAARDQHKAIDVAERNLPRAAAAADILVLAMPARELEAVLQTVAQDVQAHALVIDLSDLTGPGIAGAQRHLRQGYYVGARPVLSAATFADLRAGPAAARADLFHNSIFCLTPSAGVDPQAVETAVKFGRLLGAQPYFLDPLEYDNLVQGVATLPGLFAAALFGALSRAAGWRDVLRFADLPFALATLPLEDGANIAHLALNDKTAALRWLDALTEELDALRAWVQAGDGDALAALLEDLSRERAGWLRARAKNEWVEGLPPQFDPPSISEQMLGAFGRRRNARREDA